MSWIFFVLIGIAGTSLANILERALLKDEKSNAFAYSFVFQLVCAILIGIWAVIHGFVMPPLKELWPNLALMSVFYAAGTLFLFKSFKLAPASEVTIIFSTRVFWTIVVALVFLGESFNLSKIVGTLLILGGVILVSLNEKFSGIGKGVIYGLAAAFFWGVAFANDAYVLRYSESISYSFLAFLLPVIPLLAIRPKLPAELKPMLKGNTLLKMVSLCFVYAFATLADYYALHIGGLATQVSPALQTSIIVTVLLAAVFLGEKKNLAKKLLAALLATVGVVLLTWK